jgi:hypothetical protein
LKYKIIIGSGGVGGNGFIVQDKQATLDRDHSLPTAPAKAQNEEECAGQLGPTNKLPNNGISDVDWSGGAVANGGCG